MKKLICMMMCLSSLIGGNLLAGQTDGPKPPPPRVLATINLQDESGQGINSSNLQQDGNWLLIVLDTALPSAQHFLDKLATGNVAYDHRTTIMLIGSATQTTTVRSKQPLLTGVRWVSTESATSVKQLGLPGTPIMLGMQADQSIAWQFSGVPGSAEKLQSMLRGWLR